MVLQCKGGRRLGRCYAGHDRGAIEPSTLHQGICMANALEHVAWEPCLLEPRPDRALDPIEAALGADDDQQSADDVHAVADAK